MHPEIFKSFKIASTTIYIEKYVFMKVKEKILQQYGSYLGYYYKIKDVRCDECAGVGFYEKYGLNSGIDDTVLCDKCNGARFVKKDFYYKNYELCGEVFLVETSYIPKFGDNLQRLKQSEMKIEAEIKDSYRALLTILYWYDKNLLYTLLSYSLSAKKYWDMYSDEITSLINEIKAESYGNVQVL